MALAHHRLRALRLACYARTARRHWAYRSNTIAQLLLRPPMEAHASRCLRTAHHQHWVRLSIGRRRRYIHGPLRPWQLPVRNHPL